MKSMSYEIPLSNHIAVSELTPASELVENSLFLISERNDSTGTGYMSKQITYDRLKKQIDGDFSLTRLAQNFQSLCSITHPVIVGLETNYVSCQNVGDVYIISSLYQSNGNITSAFGYRLSTGMDYYFNNMEFNNISTNNFYSKDSHFESLEVNNLCVEEFSTTNLCVMESAFFNNTTIFKRPIIINGKSLESAYRINEKEITNESSVVISADTINVLYLTDKSQFGGDSNKLDIIITGVSSDMAFDSELFIYKTREFTQEKPHGTAVVNLNFKVDNGDGTYVENVDFITPNFISSDGSSVTDDTNLKKLVDEEPASYLYLISQITKKTPDIGNPRFYMSRQYLNSINGE